MCFAILLASFGIATAADVRVQIVRHGTNVMAPPEAVFTTNILRLLQTCSIDSTAYAVKTNTWKQRLNSDCLIHLIWTAPTRIRLMDSSNHRLEEREVDEILVPLPIGKWPDHFFAKSGSNVLSFTKWPPNALARVVSEPMLQLSSVSPYASLIKNAPPR
jgi:hypothetical protein